MFIIYLVLSCESHFLIVFSGWCQKHSNAWDGGASVLHPKKNPCVLTAQRGRTAPSLKTEYSGGSPGKGIHEPKKQKMDRNRQLSSTQTRGVARGEVVAKWMTCHWCQGSWGKWACFQKITSAWDTHNSEKLRSVHSLRHADMSTSPPNMPYAHCCWFWALISAEGRLVSERQWGRGSQPLGRIHCTV